MQLCSSNQLQCATIPTVFKMRLLEFNLPFSLGSLLEQQLPGYRVNTLIFYQPQCSSPMVLLRYVLRYRPYIHQVSTSLMRTPRMMESRDMLVSNKYCSMSPGGKAMRKQANVFVLHFRECQIQGMSNISKICLLRGYIEAAIGQKAGSLTAFGERPQVLLFCLLRVSWRSHQSSQLIVSSLQESRSIRAAREV